MGEGPEGISFNVTFIGYIFLYRLQLSSFCSNDPDPSGNMTDQPHSSSATDNTPEPVRQVS